MDKVEKKEAILSLFFPKRCRFCDDVIDFRRSECKKCADDLGEITGEICLLCGHMKKDCFCGNRKHYYRAIIAPFYYEGPAGKAIKRLKRVADEKTIDMFANEMARSFDELLPEFTYDLVTSVPLSEKTYNARGYNQAHLLAEAFAQRVSLPYVETLAKIYEVDTQRTLSKTERTGNLLGVFEPFIGDISGGKRIILIDDVKTTGATLNECAKTLMIAGAAEVVCVCAAITKMEDKQDKANKKKQAVLSIGG